MRRFVVKNYHIKNKKIGSDSAIKIIFIADLHGICYGEQNSILQQRICDEKPDIILIGGDLIVRNTPDTECVAERLLTELSRKFPVYYEMGNHETRMYPPAQKGETDYEKRLISCGIHILRNDTEMVEINHQKLIISGLELPLSFFKKLNPPELTFSSMIELLPAIDNAENYHILLAHTPRYMDTYFAWGADFVLSGHYHGGVIRFTENFGAISPQLELFPKYCCGRFDHQKQTAIVSAGLGVHTIPFRIHNPAELIIIKLTSDS